jgi:hypothetical protein
MPNRFAALVAAAIALIAAVVITQRTTTPVATINHPIGKLAPTPGPNAEGYVSSKRAYLSELADQQPDASAAALVSFGRLLRASEVEQLMTGMQVSVVFAMFPGAPPEAPRVDTTVEAAVAKRAAELGAATQAEIRSLQARHDPASGPLIDERERDLRQMQPDCACLYAAVVQKSTVGLLASLQRSSLVRLVDVPDPLTDDLSGWQLTPIAPKA